jgi:hypothetical protein
MKRRALPAISQSLDQSFNITELAPTATLMQIFVESKITALASIQTLSPSVGQVFF